MRYDEGMESQIESLLAGLGWEVLAWIVLIGVGYVISFLTHRPQLKAMRRELAEMRDQLNQGTTAQTQPGASGPATVDFLGAGAIVDAYLEPATRSMSNNAKMATRRAFLEDFENVAGAKLGEYEYNAVRLHEWMQSNAARFLVENRGDMR